MFVQMHNAMTRGRTHTILMLFVFPEFFPCVDVTWYQYHISYFSRHPNLVETKIHYFWYPTGHSASPVISVCVITSGRHKMQDWSHISLGCWEVWQHFDGRATDHVMKFPRPSPSVFAYYKRSKTGGIEGLGMRPREVEDHQISNLITWQNW